MMQAPTPGTAFIDDVVLRGLVAINALGVFAGAFYLGRLVQRVHALEEEVDEIKGQDIGEKLAELKVEVEAVTEGQKRTHQGLHDLRNFVMRLLAKVEAPPED